jgi:restriction endonuclease S subunit
MKQANLSTHAVQRLKVPVPSLEEQEEIGKYFRIIDQRIELHEKKIEALRDLFHALLHQLMTAQIRVNKLDIANLETPSGDNV